MSVRSTVLALVVVNAFSQIDRILPFILAESIKRELGLSDTQLGLVNGVAFAVCHSLLSVPLGRAADQGSPRRLLLGCILVWSLMTSLGGLAGGFLFLALTRLGVALGEAGTIPIGHAILSRKVPAPRRGLALGLFSMGIPLGTMLGFAVGGALQDRVGWRMVLIGTGATGLLVTLLAGWLIGETAAAPANASREESLLRSRVWSLPAFRWLIAGGVLIGFAAPPFYVFSATFLIRSYGLSAAEVGLTFGLLQGSLGVVGGVLGGRGYDRAVQAGRDLLLPPAWLLILGGFTTTAALFAGSALASVLWMLPGMLSFAFLLPWAYGCAHRLAGPGREAQASSLMGLASGLLGAALGPVMVGAISDAATAAHIPNGLGVGLLLVPLASLASGLACLQANRELNQGLV
jgi:predicted MFS family arabinose efflux permease